MMREDHVQGALEEKMPHMRLSVISDLHIHGTAHRFNENLKQAIADLNQVNPEADALCIVGDMTESGKDAEYDMLKEFLSVGNQKETYMILGNHDVRWLAGGYEEAYTRFLAQTDMPEGYFDKWINGYHMIFLATSEDLKDAATLSEKQLVWLEEKLGEGTDEKPIFVFLHQSLTDTSAGSYPVDGYNQSYPDGVVQGEQLITLFSKYPQAVFLTGHTHIVVDHPKTVYQKEGTYYVNTGSIAYTIASEGYGEDESSQGLCIDVYDTEVIVKGRDFKKKAWCNEWRIALIDELNQVATDGADQPIVPEVIKSIRIKE
ncbi:MAG: metallophosphoesterase family protein [Cellulosilyticaceae bacterium]